MSDLKARYEFERGRDQHPEGTDQIALAKALAVKDAEIKRLREELAGAYAVASSLSDELLRVRTAGHGAAHELDNIAVESGLGHSPAPGVVAEYVRGLRNKADRLDRLCD